MGELDSFEDLAHALDGVLPAHWNKFSQRFPLNKFHYDVAMLPVFEHIMDRYNPRMGQFGGRLGFSQKSLQALLSEELRSKRLDRCWALKKRVVGFIDNTHAAFAELGVDAIAVCEERADHVWAAQSAPARASTRPAAIILSQSTASTNK